MPRIPQIVSDVSPRTAPLSIGAAMQPGEAAARLGGDVSAVGSEIFNQQQQLWQARQAMDKTAQAGLESEKLYNQIISDPNVKDQDLVNTVQDGFKILHDRIGADIKDPAVKLIYDKNFTSLTVSRSVDAMALQRSRTIDNGRSSLETSLDTLGRLVPDATGQRLDAIMAQAEGNLSFAATSGLLSHDDATKRMIQFRDEAYTSKYIQQIRNDPGQAFSDLQSDTHLEPIKKEQLLNSAQDHIIAQANQAIQDQKVRDEESAKQRATAMDADITAATASALNGTYTHQELADLQTKYGDGKDGKAPISRENYEHIYDLINKPPTQPPSDPDTLANMKVQVNSMNPPPLSKLHGLYNSGFLNLNDYTTLSVDLEKNQKSLFLENRSQTEQILAKDFGGDAQVHADALKALQSGMSLPDIETKFKPLVEGLDGLSRASVEGSFRASRTAFEGAQKAQTNWASTHYILGALGKDNPNDAVVEAKKTDYLNAAAKADRVLGSTAKPEGSDWIINGRHVKVVGGKAVVQ